MLLAVPLVAIAVILLAVWRWGGARTAVVHGEGEARAVLAAEHPEWRPSEVRPTVDARAALACAPSGDEIAVVFAAGDSLTSRLLHRGDVASIDVAGQDDAPAMPGEPSTGARDGGAPRGGARDGGATRGGARDGGATRGQRPVPHVVRATVHLHDVGCPRLSLSLPREEWPTWERRLQRLVGALLVSCCGLGLDAAQAIAAIPRPPRPPAAAATCDTAWRVTWSPATPRPGTLVELRLTGGSSVGDAGAASAPSVTGAPSATGASAAPGVTGVPRGRMAGEPLHFRAAGDSAWLALGAVPVDAGRALSIVIGCPGDVADSLVVRLTLAPASYPLERLRVAPQFSAPPDSALAARLEREAARAAEVSRRAHETPRLWREPFAPPRSSRVTSTFGRGREFNGTVTSRHMGTDYAGAVGAPIRAANRAIVRLVDSFYLGGNVIYLDHGEGVVTAYLHLSEPLVAEGDTVERGTLIGRVGATGRVSGPHLHWIARYGRISVDPTSLLRVTGAPAALAPTSRSDSARRPAAKRRR